jgi:hypothetical protein
MLDEHTDEAAALVRDGRAQRIPAIGDAAAAIESFLA